MQLTSHTPYSADLIEHCDKHLFRAALNPTHCLHSILPPKKNMYGRNLRKKGHGRELPLAKTKWYKDSFFNTLYIQICLILIVSYASGENI